MILGKLLPTVGDKKWSLANPTLEYSMGFASFKRLYFQTDYDLYWVGASSDLYIEHHSLSNAWDISDRTYEGYNDLRWEDLFITGPNSGWWSWFDDLYSIFNMKQVGYTGDGTWAPIATWEYPDFSQGDFWGASALANNELRILDISNYLRHFTIPHLTDMGEYTDNKFTASNLLNFHIAITEKYLYYVDSSYPNRIYRAPIANAGFTSITSDSYYDFGEAISYIYLSHDGTKLYTWCSTNGYLRQYSLV